MRLQSCLVLTLAPALAWAPSALAAADPSAAVFAAPFESDGRDVEATTPAPSSEVPTGAAALPEPQEAEGAPARTGSTPPILDAPASGGDAEAPEEVADDPWAQRERDLGRRVTVEALGGLAGVALG